MIPVSIKHWPALYIPINEFLFKILNVFFFKLYLLKRNCQWLKEIHSMTFLLIFFWASLAPLCHTLYTCIVYQIHFSYVFGEYRVFVTNVSQSDYHYRIITIGLSLSDYHYRIITIRLSLSDYHYQIVTIRLALSDYRYQIITIKLSLSDYHYQIITIKLSLSDYHDIHSMFVSNYLVLGQEISHRTTPITVVTTDVSRSLGYLRGLLKFSSCVGS